MKELEYPFNVKEIIEGKNFIRKELLRNKNQVFLPKKIAILGGVTTNNIKSILELFLLNYGIKPSFYESEYNRYYEEGVFSNPELKAFAPDLIYICTSIRNIVDFPILSDEVDVVNNKLFVVCNKFQKLWTQITNIYHCPIIQNNIEYPYFRLMGNKDASDIHGRVNFTTRINLAFYEYAQTHEDFYICDINYLSASYGLDKWSDPYYWHMYKCATAIPAVPYLAFNVANIIKSIFGKNKKVLNLDLDNTLWGGVIGDEGADNIEIGQETSLAQSYSEFQEYLKLHKQLGVLLTINSKNDEKTALSGLKRPDSVLRAEDFVNIKANWNTKDCNLIETARELNILPDSFVFVDDNPAERAIVTDHIPEVAVPEIERIEQYVQILDKSGFFEMTTLSDDDINRTEMYQNNIQRKQLEETFLSYEDYLRSLEMKAEIKGFTPVYLSRIAQLTNKSNQFNLTTKRYSQSDIEAIATDSKYISLYGKLEDKFGSNGVVSVVIGRIDGEKKDELHMELWLMSCRVLMRNMEYAMMDELVKKAKVSGIKKIVGYYYPTAKNAIVKNFYNSVGFGLAFEDENGSSVWEYEIKDDYQEKQDVIKVNECQT